MDQQHPSTTAKRLAQVEPPDTNAEYDIGSALPILIGEFPANSRESARVTLETFKGHNLVCIRKLYPAPCGGWRPGNGIAVNERHLPRLSELISEAITTARNSGPLPSEDGGNK